MRTRCRASGTGATCSGTPRSSCSRSSSSPSPTPPGRSCATATTHSTGPERTPASTAPEAPGTPGSPPTPAEKSAPSSPTTEPTGSGPARRRSTSRPTSPTAYSATSRPPGTRRSSTTSARRSSSRPAGSGPTGSNRGREGTGYELRQVMGPDEFHSHIDNNAFTNRLAQWHLEQAVSLYDELRGQYPDTLADVGSRIGLKPDERDRWQEIAGGLVAARQSDGVIEQFTGYFERDDVPITEWDENNMPRYPKGYHHFNCETTKLLKQPDVVQLIYLLPDEFDARTKKANFDYYEARTLHKSSLSPCHPRDHRNRGRRHDPRGPVLRALSPGRSHRQSGQHRRGHPHRLRRRNLANPRQRVRRPAHPRRPRDTQPLATPRLGRHTIPPPMAGPPHPRDGRPRSRRGAARWPRRRDRGDRGERQERANDGQYARPCPTRILTSDAVCGAPFGQSSGRRAGRGSRR